MVPTGGAKIQVTMIQIYEQLKECLLLNPNLLTKINALFD